jgi:glyoxylase-like metal-dependent hydrolase (beta-lactamase superfamily II)
MRHALAVVLAILAGAAAPDHSRLARYTVGTAIVTALHDSSLQLPLSALSPAALVAPIAARDPAINDGKATISINAFLIQMSGHTILVDAGSGTCTDLVKGNVIDDLREAGVSPDDVDLVLLTHLHFDHDCGLITRQRQRAYPNATVWLAQSESAYWLDDKIAASQPDAQRGGFLAARLSLAPYEIAGRIHTFKGRATILPGIEAVPAPGHTPGHTAYLLRSEGHALLFWGDIVHFPTVQFEAPDITVVSDTDPAEARATRLNLLGMLADGGMPVAGAHLPFPGVGHVRKNGDGYIFEPAVPGRLP